MRMLHGTEELHSESGYGHKSVLKLNMLDRYMCFWRSYSLGNLMCTEFKVHCFENDVRCGLKWSKLLE
jgi:hypothetical protein